MNTWLLDANSTANWAWLKVILELLDKCVVSIERLKENNTAKMVKNLSRDASDNSELCAIFFQGVYELW